MVVKITAMKIIKNRTTAQTVLTAEVLFCAPAAAIWLNFLNV